MTETTEVITKKMLKIISTLDKPMIPLEILVKELANEFQLEEIEQAIEYALDNFKIDKVLDYAEKEWNLYWGYHHWHISKLTPEDATKLRNLKAVDLALLRILKNQNSPKRFGEIKSEDARVILRNQRFSEKEIEFLWVEDLVDHHYDFKDEKTIEWCRLIPEDEKTEEYKKEMERIDQEFAEKEARRMFYADVCDLESEILKAVKNSPDGISKKDIVKQLFMTDPEYVDTAFRFLTEFDEKEIIPIKLDNGEEGYRLNPAYYDEDDW